MSVSVYLAAPFQMQDEMRELAASLARHGIACTSRWLRVPDVPSDAAAREDLADIDAADVFVAVNPAAWHRAGSGGRHVEFGYAVARRKPVLLVGERSNVFHHLHGVTVVSGDFSEIARHVRALSEASHE